MYTFKIIQALHMDLIWKIDLKHVYEWICFIYTSIDYISIITHYIHMLHNNYMALQCVSLISIKMNKMERRTLALNDNSFPSASMILLHYHWPCYGSHLGPINH